MDTLTHMWMHKSTLCLSAKEAANSKLAPGPSVMWCEGLGMRAHTTELLRSLPSRAARLPSGHLGQRERGSPSRESMGTDSAT